MGDCIHKERLGYLDFPPVRGTILGRSLGCTYNPQSDIQCGNTTPGYQSAPFTQIEADAQNGDDMAVILDFDTFVSPEFDTSGNVFGSVGGGYFPQVATADGGVIATTAAVYGPNGPISNSTAATFDANLNVTGQLNGLPTSSWLGTAYQGFVTQVSALPPDFASTFAALASGNQSNTTAVKPNPYPRLKSCIQSNGTSTCPYDFLLVALQALQMKVGSNCPDCVNKVFSKIHSGADQSQFSKFINRYPPGLFDGTGSTLLLSQTCEPVSSGPPPSLGLPGNVDASFGCVTSYLQYGPGATVADYFASKPTTLVGLAVLQGVNAQDPNGKKGLILFVNPSRIYTTIPEPASGINNVSILPDSDGQVANESLLFHQALHEYYDYSDDTIQTDFGLPPRQCTANISDYISCQIFNRCRIDPGCNLFNTTH